MRFSDYDKPARRLSRNRRKGTLSPVGLEPVTQQDWNADAMELHARIMSRTADVGDLRTFLDRSPAATIAWRYACTKLGRQPDVR